MSNAGVLLARMRGNARGKPKWVEFFALLLPLLEKLFEQLMEGCADTEDDAVELVCNPRPAQIIEMRLRIRMAMFREEGVNLKRRERRVAANQIIQGFIDEANSDPETVAAAFTEVQATA